MRLPDSTPGARRTPRAVDIILWTLNNFHKNRKYEITLLNKKYKLSQILAFGAAGLFRFAVRIQLRTERSISFSDNAKLCTLKFEMPMAMDSRQPAHSRLKQPSPLSRLSVRVPGLPILGLGDCGSIVGS